MKQWRGAILMVLSERSPTIMPDTSDINVLVKLVFDRVATTIFDGLVRSARLLASMPRT